MTGVSAGIAIFFILKMFNANLAVLEFSNIQSFLGIPKKFGTILDSPKSVSVTNGKYKKKKENFREEEENQHRRRRTTTKWRTV